MADENWDLTRYFKLDWTAEDENYVSVFVTIQFKL